MELKNCFLNLFSGKPRFIFKQGGAETPKPAPEPPQKEPFRKGETARQTADRLAYEKSVQEKLNAPKKEGKPREAYARAEGIFRKGETAMQTAERLVDEKRVQEQLKQGRKVDLKLARDFFRSTRQEVLTYIKDNNQEKLADVMQKYLGSTFVMPEFDPHLKPDALANLIGRKAVEKVYADTGNGANIARMVQESYEAQQRKIAEEQEIPEEELPPLVAIKRKPKTQESK